MKKTKWFNGRKHKPARPGVYERWEPNWFSRWTGKRWKIGADNPEEAAKRKENAAYRTDKDRWRGLTTKDGK